MLHDAGPSKLGPVRKATNTSRHLLPRYVVNQIWCGAFHGEEGALRIAPWQAYRGFTLKTPIWEPHLYIHTRTPADVSPLYYPPPGVFLGVTLLYNFG